MALEGAVTGIAKIATTAVPVAVESVAKAAPAATEAIAQTAVQGTAEVGKTAIEAGAETLSESVVKAAEAQASVLSEGIANSAESAMAAGGADAALSSIGSAKIPGELPSSENQISPAGAAMAENNTESPVVPGSPAENSTPRETAETATDLVRSDGSQQEDSSEGQDNPKDETSTGHENTEKKKVLIPDEVLTREEYQEELNATREEARSKGETISEEDIQQRAFEKYIKKLLNQEDERAREENRVKELEKKMKDMEERMREIIEQNEKMMEKLEAQANAIKQLSEWAAGSEKDEEKKKNLLKLLGEITAIIAVGAVVEGGKEAIPQQK